MFRTPSSPGPLGLFALALGLCRCTDSAESPGIEGSSQTSTTSAEQPRVKPATPSSLVDLSTTLVAQVRGASVRFLDLATGAERLRHAIPRPSGVVALPDGRWVVLADSGGRMAVVFDPAGQPTARLLLPEAPVPARLLPDTDGFWLTTVKRAVHYPLTSASLEMAASDIYIKKKPPTPISLARLSDGSLLSIADGQLERRQGEQEPTRTPLPEGLEAPVRLASGEPDAVWLAPWTGPLRRMALGETLAETTTLQTTGVVFSVAAAAGRVAWLELVESAPPGPATWTLHVAEGNGTSLLHLVLPRTNSRAVEESAERGLWLSPDGTAVAVGGRTSLGVWRVADGSAVVAMDQ